MYSVPVKSIHDHAEFEYFKTSQALTDILDFVKKSAEAVVGVRNFCIDDNELALTIPVTKFVSFMNRLFVLVEEVPPMKQPMRFGNKAFRTWHEKMMEESKLFLTMLLEPFGKEDASTELEPYISEMFGNPTRIDYGTGHELNFVVFFLLLTKLGVISDGKADLSAVVTKAFTAYIRTMRKLQIDYMLEPAGSHGVWGLDDYHCLLFLWGAAQLSNQKEITPSSIHDPELLKELSAEYLYFEGIRFIKCIKSSAPFAETSPMLNDISALHDWAKICSGLMRLFQAEVLNKFPVIQHLLFGTLLRADWREGHQGSLQEQMLELELGQGHGHGQGQAHTQLQRAHSPSLHAHSATYLATHTTAMSPTHTHAHGRPDAHIGTATAAAAAAATPTADEPDEVEGLEEADKVIVDGRIVVGDEC